MFILSMKISQANINNYFIHLSPQQVDLQIFAVILKTNINLTF